MTYTIHESGSGHYEVRDAKDHPVLHECDFSTAKEFVRLMGLHWSGPIKDIRMEELGIVEAMLDQQEKP